MMAQQIEELFHASRARAPAERAEFLRSACGEDLVTRSAVQSLLTSFETSDDFLEKPAAEWIGGGAVAGSLGAGAESCIGNYRIVRVIATGGMGIVYEAQQTAPKRSVALKLLRRAFRSEAAVRRFRRESEVLGRLSHVGVAQVFEAGVQDDAGESLPYFAMELLSDAMPLTTYANTGSLDTRQRVELLCAVCEAVDYCHRQGVVHRDLKPGNILVTREGRPKVIDFGVARVHSDLESDATWHTTGAPFIGSLPYMSPEQAGLNPDAIDSQSDVYALGAIAYELLSGRMALDMGNLPPLEAARMIREDDPAPLGSLDRSYGKDMETIVATAMAKEKARRYPSVAAMLDDLQRFLRQQPIRARPTGSLAQLAKFARRNRALTGGLLTAFLGVLIGGIAAGWQGLAATRERDRAGQALAESQRVTAFVRSILQHANPKEHGQDVSVRKALDRAAERIDAELAGDSRARGAIHNTLAEAYWAIGDLDRAETHFHASLSSLPPNAPVGDSEAHCTAMQLARLYLFADRIHEAEATLSQTHERYSQKLGPDHAFVGDVLEMLGSVARARGDAVSAERQLRRALDIRRATGSDATPQFADTLIALGMALYTTSIDESIELAREVLAIRRNAGGLSAADVPWRMKQLSFFLTTRGTAEDLREAETLLREAIPLQERLSGEQSLEVATMFSELGSNLHAQGSSDGARTMLFRALDMKRSLLGKDHLEVAQTLHSIGRFLIDTGEHDEAIRILNEAMSIRRQRLGDEHTDTQCSEKLLAVAQSGVGHPDAVGAGLSRVGVGPRRRGE